MALRTEMTRKKQAASPAPAMPAEVCAAEDIEAAGADRPLVPLLITVSDASRILGLGVTTIYALINADKLGTVRVGKRRLIKYASAQALAEHGTAA